MNCECAECQLKARREEKTRQWYREKAWRWEALGTLTCFVLPAGLIAYTFLTSI